MPVIFVYSSSFYLTRSLRSAVFKFAVGTGQVIKAWDVAFMAMHKGEKATIVLKSDYGYGDRGSPPKIPGGATLCFEVELLGFGEKVSKEATERSEDVWRAFASASVTTQLTQLNTILY